MPVIDEPVRDSAFPTWRNAALFALAYFVASEIGYLLSLGPTVGGTFWPPSGVALAVFLHTRMRTWPGLAAAALGANFVSDQIHGQNLPACLGFAFANVSEPLLGAWFLRRVFGTPFRFNRLSELVGAAATVILLSAPLSSLVGALSAEAWTENPPGFGASWRTWWVGDTVGALVLAPTVARILGGWHGIRQLPARRWLEAAALVCVLVMVTQVIFARPSNSLAMPFLVFPVMIWASLRFGVVAVGASLCLVVVLTTHDTANGNGPFAAEHLSLAGRLIALQTYIGVMAVSFHVLAILWEERVQSAAALQEAHSGLEVRYRRLVEQSPLGILAARHDGTVKEVNPAWRRLWGTGPLGSQGTSLWGDPRFEELGLRPLVGRAFAGEVVELPGVWVHTPNTQADGASHPEGTPCFVRGFAYPVKNEAGTVDEVVIIERDVTEEFQVQQQLTKANDALRDRQEALSDALARMEEAKAHREQLLEAERSARLEAQRASRVKDEFLATLSHELRTPLNAIVGWTHILRRTTPDAATLDRATDAIERNARLQTKLIEDLLDMSRIIAGKMALMVGNVALSKVVVSAAEALRPAADAKKLTLTTKIEDRVDSCVRGDSARLHQVMTNLIGNSIKFTPEGGHIEVRLTQDDQKAVVSVRDTGQGIPPDFLPAVFEQFRQGDGSITRRHGGLGLGLSITKQIVEMHGGSIAAHSEGLGLGASFTVTLPTLREQAEPSVASSERVPGVQLAGLRVLAVDDQPDARELLRRLLVEYGCEVVVAGSAAEALEQLLRYQPDVLLSDIGMADIDGYELLRLARAATDARTMKAIAVTAFARPEDRELALAAGYDAHLPKPVEPEGLLRTLMRLDLRAAPQDTSERSGAA